MNRHHLKGPVSTVDVDLTPTIYTDSIIANGPHLQRTFPGANGYPCRLEIRGLPYGLLHPMGWARWDADAVPFAPKPEPLQVAGREGFPVRLTGLERRSG